MNKNRKKWLNIRLRSRDNATYLNKIYKLTESEEYTEILGISQQKRIFRKHPLLFRLYAILIVFSYPCFLLYKLVCALLYPINNISLDTDYICLLTSSALSRALDKTELKNVPKVWIDLPWKCYNNGTIPNHIGVFQLLTKNEILFCAYDSLKVFLFVLFKYGLNSVLLEYYNYSWFLYVTAVEKVVDGKTIIFCSHMDEWTVALDHFNAKRKILIQHGTMAIRNNKYGLTQQDLSYLSKQNCWTYNAAYKYKTVETLYSFTEDEYDLICKSILNNKPYKKISGYGITLNAINHNKKNILIIGYYPKYNKTEELILRSLQDDRFNLYLKNHPTLDSSLYSGMLNYYNFKLITENFYPDVDIVFSYQSTLALQYQAMGKHVYFYDDFEPTNQNIIKIALAH